MKINTNRWNRIRYTLYVPVYDLVANIFSGSRKRSIALLKIEPHDKILLVGAGTGLDLKYIPADANTIATDITPAMVKKIRRRYASAGSVKAVVMDGHNLEFPDNEFDKIILHLILAVIPDPAKCMMEVVRVLKPGGKIAVFDKFLKENQQPSVTRKLINTITNLLFTDINRRLNDIISQTELKIIHQENADFGGNFKIIILAKPDV